MRNSALTTRWVSAVSLTVSTLSLLTVSQISNAIEPPPYGPWLPLRDGNLDQVKIAFRQYSDGTLYYKIQNNYPVDVKVNCRFDYVDEGGKRHNETGCDVANLKAAQEHIDGGWLDLGVASVDTSSLVAKVSPINGASSGSAAVIEFPKREVTPVATPVQVDPGCVIGSRATGDSDGAHMTGAYSIEVSVDESSQGRCVNPRSDTPPAQPYALVITKTTYEAVIKGGVVADCKANRISNFFKCVGPAERDRYPQRRFHNPDGQKAAAGSH
jgi:hypothetical protein